MTFAGLDVHARSTHAAALELASGELKRMRFGPGGGEGIAWLAAQPLDAGAPARAFAPALRAGRERARLSRLPRGRRRPRRAQDGARRATLAARARGRVVADRRQAALLPRHRHALGARPLPRGRRLAALRPPGPARLLARARAVARAVGREQGAGLDHEDRLLVRTAAARRGGLALPARASDRRHTCPTPAG